MKPKETIADLSFNFALRIVVLYGFLVKNKEYVIARQLLKSGTSIGANIEEASAASSTKDFIFKMTIASKEARETRYWLRLLERSQIVRSDYSTYLNEIESIIKVLTKIIKTLQENISKK
jgi:four helix bundle protein